MSRQQQRKRAAVVEEVDDLCQPSTSKQAKLSSNPLDVVVSSPPTRERCECGQCGLRFYSLEELNGHRSHCHPSPIPEVEREIDDCVCREMYISALRGMARSIRFSPVVSGGGGGGEAMPVEFLQRARPLMLRTLEELRRGSAECRVHAVLTVRMRQIDATTGNTLREEPIIFSTRPFNIFDLEDFERAMTSLIAMIESFTDRGSNWVVVGLDKIDFKVTRYRSVPAFRGRATPTACYKLPPRLQKKKAVINLAYNPAQYKQDECFKWAYLAAIHHKDIGTGNKNRQSKYIQFEGRYNFTGITFPFSVGQVRQMEKQNPGVYINILHWDEEDKSNNSPLRVLMHAGRSSNPDQPGVVVNILAIDSYLNQPAHYLPVVNINRLIYDRSVREHATLHCERCLQPFVNQTLLDRHRNACYQGVPETLVPSQHSTHKFTNFSNRQKLPYVVYADMECMIDPVSGGDGDAAAATMRKHSPIAFGFLVVPHAGMKATPLDIPYQQFVGEKCVEEGMYALESIARSIAAWVNKYGDQKVEMSADDWRAHNACMNCYVCGKKFGDGGGGGKNMKVVEHDHLTGEYRGAACQECNNKMRLRRLFLPVFFHNFKNYDAHAICIESLGKMKHWTLEVIPQTKEKYMSIIGKFALNGVRGGAGKKSVLMTVAFRDSYQFLTSSLDGLVRNLDAEQLVYASKVVPRVSMAASKGVFPYSYLDSCERLTERQLPAREQFFDDLSQSECSVEDYERACEAWRVIGCESFEDYLLFYLRLDVHQLADVFETFRDLCLKEDGLEPSYYVTLPGMTWDSAFKMTGCEVDLLSDAEMFEFFERGIRGGMTFVNKHFVRVNSERVPDVYDSTKKHTDILYVDANNLYGNALSQKLPQSEFKWMSERELAEVNISEFDYVGGDVAHIFEVDMEYPPEVQDVSRDVPFCPEKETIGASELSEVMRAQWEDLSATRYGRSGVPYKGCQKLLLTHWNREKYVVHGRVLQFYLKKGMRLTKIHRAIRFKQSAFFEPYISYNSRRRQQAVNSFEKDYYKLRNNALFGKTMENVRRRLKFRLCNTEEGLVTLASRPDYLDRHIFNEDLVGVHLAKDKVFLCKPVFVGQAVLDLSKLEMYELRYGALDFYSLLFGGEIGVIGGDTDSFFLEISGISVDDLLAEMVRDNLLDTSNYPKDHPLYSERNKARLGCIKDESAGVPFREIVMLRPKAYSIQSLKPGVEIKRAKGVQRSVLRKEITHNDYVRAYRENIELLHTQRRIGSSLHQLYTYTYRKRSLSFFEDKRYWVNANCSLPYGHHSLSQSRPSRPRVFYPPTLL